MQFQFEEIKTEPISSLEKPELEGMGPQFDFELSSGRKLKYWPYQSLLVSAETGMPLSLAKVGMNYNGKTYKKWPSFSPEAPARKRSDLRLIKISLGFKCNYSCSYCSQSAHRSKEPEVPKEQLELLLAQLDKHLNSDHRQVKFELWGGEPLAYWPIFKVLVARLRTKYPDCKISTVTNGSLLDEEKVNFLDQMDLSVAISHDGPGYHLRGRDPLENSRQRKWIVELASRLLKKEKFNFNCVLTKDNYSLKKIYEHLRERVGMDFPLSTEGVVSYYSEAQKNEGPILSEDSIRIWRQVHADLTEIEKSGQPFFFRVSTCESTIYNFYQSIATARPANSLGQKCGMDSETALSVDLNGNVTTCQNVGANTGHKIGELADFDNVRLSTSYHWSEHSNCRNCPVLQLCKGSCMYLSGEQRRPTCDAHFAFYFGVLSAAIQLLTGDSLVSVRSDRVRIDGQSEVNF